MFGCMPMLSCGGGVGGQGGGICRCGGVGGWGG